MAKNTVTVEIRKIPVEVEIPELGYVEIADLAARVEQEMYRLQEEDGVIDTLRQALTVALIFAAKSYLKELSDGGKMKEDTQRLDHLIAQLQGTLETQK
jgi:cell division protein ZapA (FtsZ GTPase activity inhibitor)